MLLSLFSRLLNFIQYFSLFILYIVQISTIDEGKAYVDVDLSNSTHPVTTNSADLKAPEVRRRTISMTSGDDKASEVRGRTISMTSGDEKAPEFRRRTISVTSGDDKITETGRNRTTSMTSAEFKAAEAQGHPVTVVYLRDEDGEVLAEVEKPQDPWDIVTRVDDGPQWAGKASFPIENLFAESPLFVKHEVCYFTRLIQLLSYSCQHTYIIMNIFASFLLA